MNNRIIFPTEEEKCIDFNRMKRINNDLTEERMVVFTRSWSSVGIKQGMLKC